MVGFRGVFATLSLSTALISPPLSAQTGYATVIHTVSVTVPPRVKVQVSSFTVPTVSSQSVAASKPVGGVAVRVTATQPWILSIGAARKNGPALKWSRSSKSGYAPLSVKQATVAAAEHRTTSVDERLFLRADGDDRADDAPVVLTIAAQ